VGRPGYDTHNLPIALEHDGLPQQRVRFYAADLDQEVRDRGVDRLLLSSSRSIGSLWQVDEIGPTFRSENTNGCVGRSRQM
jgi:hypothetical protein